MTKNNHFSKIKLPFWTIPIRIVLRLYLFGILFFTLLRMLFFGANIKQIDQIKDERIWNIAYSFLMGWRFDTVVSMYLLAIPALFVLISYHINSLRRTSIQFAYFSCIITYPITFLISAADIPFYTQFGSRFNTMAFAWIDNPKFVAGMILGEVRYWVFSIPLFAIIWIWIRILSKHRKSDLAKKGNNISVRQTVWFGLTSLFILAFMFLGMRGRIEKKSPIRIGTAFFSNYNFPNQMALNPSFTLLRSWLDDLNPENQELRLMDDQKAMATLQEALLIKNTLPNESPIARRVTDSTSSSRPNVILIIMESMSAAKMKRYGNPLNLTPNLESLAPHALFFNNIYTAGIHTYNGIFSTLYSFPALLKKHPMNEFPTPIYSGLPGVLKQNGYQTTFFLTHDDQFDNLGGFLKANHFNKIVSQKDYPSTEVLSTLGVPDHFMFEYAIKEISKNRTANTSFFATLMTGSDHGPYIIPENIPFKPTTKNLQTGIVEYADWSIGHFIELAKKEPWFDNTIFVFIADHGYSGNSPYEVSLDYHHTPFIIYSPKLIPEGKGFDHLGLQIDLAPTVLGFLHMSYINNTPGINLLKERRKHAAFSSDDLIGCLSDSLYSVIRPDGTQLLYRYRNGATENILSTHKTEAQTMKSSAFSLLQASQWLIKNKKTPLIPLK